MRMTANVIGLTFRFKDTPELEQLRPSGPVQLVGEPDNKYDSKAVKVMQGDVFIGYLQAKHPAQLMFHEPGVTLTAEVQEYSYFDNTQKKGAQFNDEHVGRLGSITLSITDGNDDDGTVQTSPAVVIDHQSYTRDGKKYMRCTKVTEAFQPGGMDRLIEWAYKEFPTGYAEYKEGMSLLADEGTGNHDAIEKFINGDTSIEIPHGARNFIEKYQPVVISTECTVYDEEAMTAGTSDLLCTIDGIKTIVDWKRAKKVRASMVMQGSFYAVNENAQQVMVVALGADTVQGYSLKTVGEEKIKLEYEKFCMLRELLRLTQGW